MVVAQLYSSYELCNKPSPQDYFAHHGIRGQKWGKRNGPPYPLDAEDHSAAEKKAGWRESLDKKGKKPDNKGKSKDSGPSKKDLADKQISNNSDTSKKGLTDKQKRIARNVVIGAAVTAAVLGTAYVVGKNRYDKKLAEYRDFTGKLTRMRLADKLSETPVDQLSDEDTVIKAGYSHFQRIIKGSSVKTALGQERLKDVMFATYDQNDNNWYKNFVKLKDWEKNAGFKKIAMNMTNKNDLIMPSERKRISTFVEMIKKQSGVQRGFVPRYSYQLWRWCFI